MYIAFKVNTLTCIKMDCLLGRSTNIHNTNIDSLLGLKKRGGNVSVLS